MARGFTGGLDEAGRGPVVGPLVVACAITDDPENLARIGVRDSKELTPTARARLEGELKDGLAGFAVVALEPRDVDRAVRSRGLNGAEARAFARAAGAAASKARLTALDRLEADAADANERTFALRLKRELAVHAARLTVRTLVSEHKADARFPAVAAASILAKVERDRRVRKLGESVGADIGSGYPHDPNTLAFLRDYIRAQGDLPSFARRSWKTARNLMLEVGGRTPPLANFEPEVEDGD